jgi:Na+-transporting NADH:ubiquinone oxidoreductase subunit NqrC
MKIASYTSNRAKRASNTREAYRVNAVLSSVIRVVLHLAGFGLLTMAGFQWNIIAGLIVAGVSCFALSTLMASGGGDNAAVSRAPDMRRG